MRRFLINLCGFLLVALCLGWLLWSLAGSRDYTMPDGSFIRVEKVTFGKQEDIKLGGPIEKLKATLPASWQAKWPGPKRPGRNFSWRQNAVMHAMGMCDPNQGCSEN